eukprot:6486651-Amphidinium_carterae.1
MSKDANDEKRKNRNAEGALQATVKAIFRTVDQLGVSSSTKLPFFFQNCYGNTYGWYYKIVKAAFPEYRKRLLCKIYR